MAPPWRREVAARQLGQGAPPPAAALRAPIKPRAFRGGIRRILLVKELRLLWRDPELLAAVSLQLAYMVPAFGLIFAGGEVSPARLAAATVLFTGLLPASLAWLTICGEDVPDLIASAPVPGPLVTRAKVAAACLPALVLALVPIAVIAAREPAAALVAMALCPVAALGAALQQYWLGRPQPRRTFRARQKGSLLLAIAEYTMAGGWSAAAALLVRGSWLALLPATVAAAVLAVSWLRRR